MLMIFESQSDPPEVEKESLFLNSKIATFQWDEKLLYDL